MEHMIYADNAATTQLDTDAFEAMKQYLINDYGNASQPYSFSRPSKKALNEARSIVADCIGASPEEIYFTSGGTESDNWALKGLSPNGNRNKIITSLIEHHAIINSCTALGRMDVPVGWLPVDNNGLVTSKSLEKMISTDTKLVSVMLVNNEIGTIEPISDLASIAHEYGALFHTDAVQAVGHIPINVMNLNVDMLSASGHKFNGPKGIGFLYIKEDVKINPYIDGGMQESGMRAGTENVAYIMAMAVALKKNCKNMRATEIKLNRLEKDFVEVLNLAGIDYIRNGANNHAPGNISISIRNADGEMLLHRLDLMGICISTGSACDSVNTQVSHVIKAIDVPDDYAEGTIRVSFGAMNDEKDAIEVAKGIVSILKK